MRFDELMLGDELLDALEAMHFEECTPIQEQSIPLILQGRDLVACAQTGTGKTAAYLLPIIDCIAEEGLPEDAINCIVMSPTRELAQQIDQQLDAFAYFMPVSSLAIYGGTDGAEFGRQQRGLKMGADVVIATPGRLLDHLRMGAYDLSRVSFFVLDEADRMLDMGFYDDIMQIFKRLPSDCQILLFSATMPPKTRKLAQEILKNPAEVKIAISRPTEKIDQSAYVCHEAQKERVLLHIFKTCCRKRVIVFASSKLKVKDLARSLRRAGYKAAEMHSDLDQLQRNKAMTDFRNAHTDILVATDIVARGIDIDDIAMVINFDVPSEAEDYVHRIGRTARANAEGAAITLVAGKDQNRFGYIERFLGYEIKKNPVPEHLGEAPEYRPGRRSSSASRFRRGGGNRSNNPRRGNSRNTHKDNSRKPDKRNQRNPGKANSGNHRNGNPRGGNSHNTSCAAN